MEMSHRPYIVGNWKMNGTRSSLAEARSIDRGAERYLKVEVALTPPFTLLHAFANDAEWIGIGAQNCHSQASGAHTGDISAPMVADAGASFVILGHSERRADHGETNSHVRAKVEAALAAGLKMIVCCGESKDIHDKGEAVAFVTGQLAESLPEEMADPDERLTIGYEPVWAVGSGVTPTPKEIEAMHVEIRKFLTARFGAEAGAQIRIIYGGSVTAENVNALLAGPNVNGALVGGASLSAEDFLGIVSIVAEGAAR